LIEKIARVETTGSAALIAALTLMPLAARPAGGSGGHGEHRPVGDSGAPGGRSTKMITHMMPPIGS
jgi:hypothetical protein